MFPIICIYVCTYVFYFYVCISLKLQAQFEWLFFVVLSFGRNLRKIIYTLRETLILQSPYLTPYSELTSSTLFVQQIPVTIQTRLCLVSTNIRKQMYKHMQIEPDNSSIAILKKQSLKVWKSPCFLLITYTSTFILKLCLQNSSPSNDGNAQMYSSIPKWTGWMDSCNEKENLQVVFILSIKRTIFIVVKIR